MTFTSIVNEIEKRFPELLEHDSFDLFGNDPPLTYPVFETLLISALEDALIRGDLLRIQKICTFIEEVSLSAKTDTDLANLIRISVGEWLPSIQYEDRLAPWLGTETKSLSGYVPGLATQRRADALKQSQRRLSSRLRTLAHKLKGNPTC